MFSLCYLPSRWLSWIQGTLWTHSISTLHVIIDEEILDEVLFIELQKRPCSHVLQDCLATRLVHLSINVINNLLRRVWRIMIDATNTYLRRLDEWSPLRMVVVLKGSVVWCHVVSMRREADSRFLYTVHAGIALLARVVGSAALCTHLFHLQHDVALILRFTLEHGIKASWSFLAWFAIVDIQVPVLAPYPHIKWLLGNGDESSTAAAFVWHTFLAAYRCHLAVLARMNLALTLVLFAAYMQALLQTTLRVLLAQLLLCLLHAEYLEGLLGLEGIASIFETLQIEWNARWRLFVIRRPDHVYHACWVKRWFDNSFLLGHIKGYLSYGIILAIIFLLWLPSHFLDKQITTPGNASQVKGRVGSLAWRESRLKLAIEDFEYFVLHHQLDRCPAHSRISERSLFRHLSSRIFSQACMQFSSGFLVNRWWDVLRVSLLCSDTRINRLFLLFYNRVAR